MENVGNDTFCGYVAGWWGIAFDVCGIIMHSEQSYNVKEHHLATIELCSYCCNEMEIS